MIYSQKENNIQLSGGKCTHASFLEKLWLKPISYALFSSSNGALFVLLAST